MNRSAASGNAGAGPIIARSQDAVIELAVDELERRLREQRESDAWERASTDPGFGQETAELDAAYRSADRETWPA